ncbi:hypothetical protein F1559_002261 [Cyanidiococcus yangmingshanensis]|uniref:Uncharacterized protein n=1 Tax=Cyanidiococcus yangmingshanensis TaxID=2690220 RepID=A0A7J7IPZ6_9RHOD|nr:hypothetical protein F1559_002261 [Cyanidiococcus yangmingshanensis]
MQMESPEIQDSLSLEKRIQSQQAVQMEHSETASGPRQKIRPSSKHHSIPTCSDAAHSASDATGPDEHVLRKRETHNLHTRVSRQKISHCFEHLVAVLTAGCALEESDLIVCNELDGACIPEHRTVCACCGVDHCARKECLMCKTSSNGATTASKSDGTEGCQANPTFDGQVDSVAPKRDHQSRLNEPGTCCGWRDRAVARRQRASALRQRLRHRAETLQYATQTIIELRRERRLLELHLLMASETFRKSWMREVVRQIADRDQVIVDAGNMLAECCKPVIRAVLEHFQWPFAELWVLRTRPATVEKALHAEWYTSDAMHVWLSHEATLIVPLPLTILENEGSLSLSTTPQAAERVETSERLKLAAVPNEVPCPDQTDLLGTRSPRVEAMQPVPSDQCMDASRCSLVRENSSDARTKTQLSQSFIECKSQEEQDAATLLVRELEQFALESKRQTPDTVLDIQHRALECERPVGVRIRSGQVVAFDPETDSECDGVPFARLALAQKHGLRCLVAIPVKQRTNPANDKRMRASAFGSPESSIQSVIVVGTVVVDASLRPLMGAVEALLQCLFDELMTYI